MRVAVSGVSGFVGVHLTRELVGAGHQVFGLGIGAMVPVLEGLLVDYLEQDLAQSFPDVGANAVVHLAGLSAVGPSFADPQAYLQGNSAPMTRLCEGLLAAGRSPRIVVVSTGAVYAPGVDLDESAPTEATSPYAVSKLLVEAQAAYYRRRGLDIVVMRPFNHLGPGQQRGFLLPDLIAGVREGQLTVGDLSTKRDYTDVRDVARAYRLAVEARTLSVAVLNVCAGVSVSGQAMLDLVVAALDVTMPQVYVDPDRLRPGDPPEIRGSHDSIASMLGWKPSFELHRTVQDTVADSA